MRIIILTILISAIIIFILLYSFKKENFSPDSLTGVWMLLMLIDNKSYQANIQGKVTFTDQNNLAVGNGYYSDGKNTYPINIIVNPDSTMSLFSAGILQGTFPIINLQDDSFSFAIDKITVGEFKRLTH